MLCYVMFMTFFIAVYDYFYVMFSNNQIESFNYTCFVSPNELSMNKLID